MSFEIEVYHVQMENSESIIILDNSLYLPVQLPKLGYLSVGVPCSDQLPSINIIKNPPGHA